MSRKDTIMIAVLLNAGLLIVLFATTLKSHPSQLEVKPVALQENIGLTHPQEEIKQEEVSSFSKVKKTEVDSVAAPSLDEVEQAIRKYARAEISTNSMEITPHFGQDLQAIGEGGVNPLLPSGSSDQKESPVYKEVKVKKGDVLEKIAKAHNTTVAEIMKLNKLHSASLKIGQVLKLPQLLSKTHSETVPIQQQEPAKYYTVKHGDNPWTIAVKNHMKVEELLKLNNLNEEKAKHLKPGDQLRIQ